MSWARRIAGTFVAPAGEHQESAGSERRSRRAPRVGDRVDRARPSTAERPPPAIAVLAPAADAPALGAALGMALVRAGRVPLCVVCVWSPGRARAGWHAPPMPAASRVASTLRGRGHDARASGRLVIVRLSADAEEAASQALRVGGAAAAAPTVVVLAGPRAAAFDALLAMQDLVVVAIASASDASLAWLASDGLERTLTCAVPPADPARALAAAGLVLLPSTRRALAGPVAALA